MIFALANAELGPFRYTDAEMAMLARLALVKVDADAGDRKAKKQIAGVKRKLNTLRRQARRGNAKAARRVRVIEESGLLEPSQVFAME